MAVRVRDRRTATGQWGTARLRRPASRGTSFRTVRMWRTWRRSIPGIGWRASDGLFANKVPSFFSIRPVAETNSAASSIPRCVDLVDEIEPVEAPPIWRGVEARVQARRVERGEHATLFMRIHDRAGTFVGTICPREAGAGHVTVGDRRGVGRPRSPRPHGPGRTAGSSPRGRVDGRPGSVFTAGTTPLDRAVLRVRSSPRPCRRSVHRRSWRHRRPSRR